MMTYMKEIMIAVFQSSLMNDDDHHHLISLGSMKVKKSLLRTWSYLPPQAFLFQKFCEIIFKTIFQKLLKTFLFVRCLGDSFFCASIHFPDIHPKLFRAATTQNV